MFVANTHHLQKCNTVKSSACYRARLTIHDLSLLSSNSASAGSCDGTGAKKTCLTFQVRNRYQQRRCNRQFWSLRLGTFDCESKQACWMSSQLCISSFQTWTSCSWWNCTKPKQNSGNVTRGVTAHVLFPYPSFTFNNLPWYCVQV